jgi:hypothetical protein
VAMRAFKAIRIRQLHTRRDVIPAVRTSTIRQASPRESQKEQKT